MKCLRPKWRGETNSHSRAKSIAKRWRKKGYHTRVVPRAALYSTENVYEIQTCGGKRKGRR